MKIDYVKLIKDLRLGNEVVCPKCKEGNLITPYDYKTSTYFYCTKCDCEININ